VLVDWKSVAVHNNQKGNKMQTVVTFALDKETKNAQRFTKQGVADAQNTVVGSLYIEKTVAAQFKTAKVTIELE
jgi:hypothetical protein